MRLINIQPLQEAVKYSHTSTAPGEMGRDTHGAYFLLAALILRDSETHKLIVPLDTQDHARTGPDPR